MYAAVAVLGMVSSRSLKEPKATAKSAKCSKRPAFIHYCGELPIFALEWWLLECDLPWIAVSGSSASPTSKQALELE